MTDKLITKSSSFTEGNDSFKVWQDGLSGLRFDITKGGASMRFRLEDYDVEKIAVAMLGFAIDRRIARKIETLDNKAKRCKSMLEEIHNWKE